MKTLLAFSGGLGSTVLLWQLLKDAHLVEGVFFDYGQPAHQEELAAARRIWEAARNVGPGWIDADLQVYRCHSIAKPAMAARRLVLLGIAMGVAEGMLNDGVKEVTLAWGDRCDTMPDGFAEAWANLANRESNDRVSTYCPYGEKTAGYLVRTGDILRAPLFSTWSCERHTLVRHCGECRGCKARRNAFAAERKFDHTLYLRGDHATSPCNGRSAFGVSCGAARAR